MSRFVFTCGDINGIGPEITVKVFNELFKKSPHKLILVSPLNVFEESIKLVKSEFAYEIITPEQNVNGNEKVVTVINSGESQIDIGAPTESSGCASFNSIKIAFELVSRKSADAIITNPISKHAFKLAGINFPGHTELLAEWSETEKFVMMFLSEEMKCALTTIHEPLSRVPKLLSVDFLVEKIEVIKESLKFDFGINNPNIAVLGLNPHAGEQGKIGSEEDEIIIPAINKTEAAGPFVPDAFFANRSYKNYDLVLGMYHDQVLIPFKMLNFNTGVNFTAGLPILRTSPDHGTAFDIAGKNIADHQSLLEAFYWAEKILKKRNQN